MAAQAHIRTARPAQAHVVRVPADAGPGVALCAFLMGLVALVLLLLGALPSGASASHTPQVIQPAGQSTGYEFIGSGVQAPPPPGVVP